MLYFPAIGHAITIAIRIGGVERLVIATTVEIGGIGCGGHHILLAIIAHVRIVMTPEITLAEIESKNFGTIGNPITIGVDIAGVG